MRNLKQQMPKRDLNYIAGPGQGDHEVPVGFVQHILITTHRVQGSILLLTVS